jgi:hypothetical protein
LSFVKEGATGGVSLLDSIHGDAIRAKPIGDTGPEIADFKASLVDDRREPYVSNYCHRIAPAGRFRRQHLINNPFAASLLP